MIVFLKRAYIGINHRKYFPAQMQANIVGGKLKHLDVSLWPKRKIKEAMLAIASKDHSTFRNDSAFHLLLNELDSRSNNRLFYLSLSISILLPLFVLELSRDYTEDLAKKDSEFEEHWLELQNGNHEKLISVLRELPRKSQKTTLKALKAKNTEEGKGPANAKR